MAEANTRSRSPLGTLFIILLAIALLAAGIYYAPDLVPKPKIGIIRVNYDIFSNTAAEFTQQLKYAREHEDIKAVVLVINSPGGSATYSEEMYLEVLHTREELPVVASIDLLAASGAYFTAAGADEIFAKPTSFIGSIGVIASFPGPVFIDDDILTTGPYKLFGSTREGVVRQVELAKFTFLDAVATGRGDRLVVSLDELARAEIYTGVQAQELGLIDGLMSTEEVIEYTADQLGFKEYEVVELFQLTFASEESQTFFQFRPEPIDAERLWAMPTNLPPGLYYRYMELPANR